MWRAPTARAPAPPGCSALQACGLKVGLYTSPYVLEFRERFQIDGEMIPKEELVEEVETLAPIADQFEAGDQVTEFEYITAWPFTGLPGAGAISWCWRWAWAAGLTPPTPSRAGGGGHHVHLLDHTAILGTPWRRSPLRRPVLSRRAAGWCSTRPGPRVTGGLEQICQERHVELFRPRPFPGAGGGALPVRHGLHRGDGPPEEWLALHPLPGGHQVKNAITALKVLEVLQSRGWPVTPQGIARGFERAFIPARMEVISKEPLVLLDGGHNPGCSHALRQALEAFVPSGKWPSWACWPTRTAGASCKCWAPFFDTIVTSRPRDTGPCPPSSWLRSPGSSAPRPSPAGSCREALAVASRAMKQDAALIVCGSFYLAGRSEDMLKGKFGNWNVP